MNKQTGRGWIASATLALVVGMVIFAGTAHAAFPTDWGYKVSITIDKDDIESALTDWTLVFDQSFDDVLTSVNGPLDGDGTRPSLSSDGGDVRFSLNSDGTGRLPCDIRSWDTNAGSCEVAVLVSNVSATADTTIWMWWGKASESQPAASDTYGQYNAYDSNTEGVYIFNETLPGGSGTVKNRKANSEHGTPANMESGDVVDGEVGKAYRFGGGNERVGFGDVHNFDTDSFTIECLHSRTSDIEKNNLRLFSKGANNNNAEMAGWALWRSDTNGNFGVNPGGARTYAAAPAGSYTTGTMQHMAGVCDRGGNQTHWVDGVAGTPASAPAGSVTGTESFRVATDTGETLSHKGDIDELRLSLVARSDAWIKADYHNQLNTTDFLTWGNIEETAAATTTTAAATTTTSVATTTTTTTASADLLVYEGFDMGGANNSPLSGQAGATSSGFDAASTWGNVDGFDANTFQTAGLSFGSGSTELQVIGGKARSANAGTTTRKISRPLDVTVIGTVYGAYLFNRVSTTDGPKSVGGVLVNQSTTGSDNDAEFAAQMDEWGTTLGGMRGDNGSGDFINTGTVASDGTTYMALFTVTNLGGASGTVDMNQWFLTSAQFDNFRPGGLTPAELNAAAVGTDADQVLQKGSNSWTPGGVYPRLTDADVLMMLNWHDTIDLDEIRFSDQSLTEATPIAGTTTTTAAGTTTTSAGTTTTAAGTTTTAAATTTTAAGTTTTAAGTTTTVAPTTTTTTTVGGGGPLATGGTITQGGGYYVHSFTSSGTFTPSTGLSVEYLVVGGGGGGGGGYEGGGGGGGGVVTGSVTMSTTYTITVGGGGSNNIAATTDAENGDPSSIAGVTNALGGGYGGTGGLHPHEGGDGASGGGSGLNAGGSGTQGNKSDGGQGYAFAAGGGGGAGLGQNGADGDNGTPKVGGDGGDGLESSISGTATYYGGGGGGGVRLSSGVSGSGGLGGGGNGGKSATGSNGTPNTGGGGGGGGSAGGTANGGDGGSGIVIIRYADPDYVPPNGTLFMFR
ncbi:MAG: hypothetical protein QGH42_06020 [Kiritimatiellia bacterium]|nr:hypothetical protein [Kiritimatiellia bacterium]